MIEKYSRIYADIDLSAVEHNMDSMADMISEHTKMIGVIKTDGYGHGSVPIAKLLERKEYLYGFAVASPEEGFILRKAGIMKPIMVLGYTFPYAYEEMIQKDIMPTVFRMDMAEQISEVAKRIGKTAKIHIKTDTGMGRIGILPNDEGIAFAKKVDALEGLEIEGVFTHFAKADELDKTFTKRQLQLFKDFTDRLKEEGISYRIRHCSNSAGILEIKEANMDVVRAGISLYGLWPSDEVEHSVINLKPALSLHSHVVFIKEVPSGTPISYGGIYVSDSNRKIATIPVGYGDGYPRGLSNQGYVLIEGRKAPIVGRVCMDQFMVDVTDISGVREGSEVVLIGKQGKEEILMEELGDISGRFNYELACDLGKRIPRVYRYKGEIIGTKDYYNDEYLQINWQ